MGGAPVVILLVGLLFPVLLLLLAALVDVLVVLWVTYRMWREEWSLTVGRAIRHVVHVSDWHLLRLH